jgi:hypothetical protein
MLKIFWGIFWSGIVLALAGIVMLLAVEAM